MQKQHSIAAGLQLLLLGSAVFAAPQISVAQQLPSTTSTKEKNEISTSDLTEQQKITLQQITITAARASGTMTDLPMSVNVISGADLERRVVRDIQDMVRYEPGVSVN